NVGFREIYHTFFDFRKFWILASPLPQGKDQYQAGIDPLADFQAGMWWENCTVARKMGHGTSFCPGIRSARRGMLLNIFLLPGGHKTLVGVERASDTTLFSTARTRGSAVGFGTFFGPPTF